MTDPADVEAMRALAGRLADAADEVALPAASRSSEARLKRDGTLVTDLDEAVERRLREVLAREAPDHAVVGEEQGGALPDAGPAWVIDPIDATSNLVRGAPVWATLVCLLVDREPVAAAVSAPAMGARWDAGAGLGARRDGRPLHVSGVDDLADAQVLHAGLSWFRSPPSAWEALGGLVDRCWRTRGFGDFWMHVLVAEGVAEVAVDRDLSLWDVAAPALVVGEAGGTVTGLDGRSPLDGGTVISSNGVVHHQVLDALAPLAGSER